MTCVSSAIMQEVSERGDFSLSSLFQLHVETIILLFCSHSLPLTRNTLTFIISSTELISCNGCDKAHNVKCLKVDSNENYNEIKNMEHTTNDSENDKNQMTSSSSQQRPSNPSNDSEHQSVPEFISQLFSMVCDPSLSHLLSWCVPQQNEPANVGRGMQGMGRIVIHYPSRLEEEGLGKYFTQSNFDCFQRQLYKYGFKKRDHSYNNIRGKGKKGTSKFFSYVHEKLGPEPHSLLEIRRNSGKQEGNYNDNDVGSGNENEIDNNVAIAAVASASTSALLSSEQIKVVHMPEIYYKKIHYDPEIESNLEGESHYCIKLYLSPFNSFECLKFVLETRPITFSTSYPNAPFHLF